MPPKGASYSASLFFNFKFLDSHEAGSYLIFAEADHGISLFVDIEIGVFIHSHESVNGTLCLRHAPLDQIFIRRGAFVHLPLNAFICDVHVILAQQILQRQLPVLRHVDIIVITQLLRGNPAFKCGKYQ